MIQSDNIADLATALAKAQAQVEGAKKDSANPHFKSRYADLASVWEACREALTSNGLSVVQFPGAAADGVMALTTQLTHSSGQWMRQEMSLPMQKIDLQGAVSATTYMRRVALAAVAGVAPEDDDGNAAARPAQGAVNNNRVAPESPRQQPERLKGPIKTRAELRTACGNLVREIHGCGDEDQLDILLVDQKPLMDQVKAEHPFFWEGDGADFLGLAKEIQNARNDMRKGAQTPLSAG